MKKELKMLQQAHHLLINLFDMGYSYPSSIEILTALEKDIDFITDYMSHSKDTPEDPLEEDEPPFDLPF